MPASASYVPRPVWEVHPQRYRVQKGDKPTSIALAFGRRELDYSELVGANLEKRVTSQGSLPGHAFLFETLAAGEQLAIPSWWEPRHQQTLGAPVLKIDPVTTFFIAAYLELEKATPNAPQAWRSAVVNACVQWWNAENPNVVPTGATSSPNGSPDDYLMSALRWMSQYGQKMAPQTAAALPWTEIPWAQVPFLAVPWLAIAWQTVRAWTSSVVQPGMVLNNTSPPGWATTDWKRQAWSQVPWSTLPFAQVPWGETPWSKVSWPVVSKGGPNNTQTLITQIKGTLPATACADCGVPKPIEWKPLQPGVWPTHPQAPAADPAGPPPKPGTPPPATPDPNAAKAGMSTGGKVVVAATVLGVAIAAGNFWLNATKKTAPKRTDPKRGQRP